MFLTHFSLIQVPGPLEVVARHQAGDRPQQGEGPVHPARARLRKLQFRLKNVLYVFYITIMNNMFWFCFKFRQNSNCQATGTVDLTGNV